MRVSSGMYYDNIYGTSTQKLNKQLFDVNKQIASELKIQYAQEDVGIFAETMRLDNEIAALEQSKKSSENGYKMSNQTDTILNDFELSLDRMKTLLVQSASGAQNSTSLDAIAKELRGIESHLKNLANSSINGQYIFSGSAVNIKPIDTDGKYFGNDSILESFTGSRTSQQYNISGAELFLGEEVAQKKEVTTNVINYSMTAKYPQLNGEFGLDGTDKPITAQSTIRDLMGDTDENIDSTNAKHHFYVRGTTTAGVAFNEQISMKDSENVGELLEKIGEAYGNSADLQVVNVEINNYGEIVIEDKIKGSSKLDFHMVGATDFSYNGLPSADKADINNTVYGVSELGKIENLSIGETDFNKIINGRSTVAEPNLYVKSFIQSDFTSAKEFEPKLISAQFTMSGAVSAGETLSMAVAYADGTATTYTQAFNVDAATTYDALKSQIELSGNFLVTVNNDTVTLETTTQGMTKGASISSNLTNDNPLISTATNIVIKPILNDMNTISYDDTQFSKNGSKLNSNVSQIIKETNAFATPATKLSEVADISQVDPNTLDAKTFLLAGKDVNGTQFEAEINLKSSANGGSTFSLNGGVTNYMIFDMQEPRGAVDADNMTYRQLMDVVNMITTGQLPSSTNIASSYDSAIEDSNLFGSTSLTYDGKIEFDDKKSTDTKAVISLHDENSGNFSNIGSPSVMSFNANNALTLRDPKTDFFKTIDEIIKTVEEGKVHPDSKNGNARGFGIQNAIQMVDDLTLHVSKIHSKVGAQSNALDASVQRNEMLKISAITLRSSVIDTDLAEASLRLSQIKLNYEAMLSSAAKVSKLSLVNYL